MSLPPLILRDTVPCTNHRSDFTTGCIDLSYFSLLSTCPSCFFSPPSDTSPLSFQLPFSPSHHLTFLSVFFLYHTCLCSCFSLHHSFHSPLTHFITEKSSICYIKAILLMSFIFIYEPSSGKEKCASFNALFSPCLHLYTLLRWGNCMENCTPVK